MKIKNNVCNLLVREHYGFSGVTHWLIAVFLFFCMWLVPWSFSANYVNEIKSNILFGILVFFIIGGASLLPDLDSSPLEEGGSTAIYQLGVLGYLLSIIFITLSGVVYTLFHTKHDDKPKSQHRMLWHTFLIPLLIYLYTKIEIPNNSKNLWSTRDNIEYIGIWIMVFFCAISVYLGASMLLYRIFSLIGQKSKTQMACLIIMVVSTIYMITVNFKKLKLIGIALALGYLFHILGDLLTKGSSPIFFPIPIRLKKKWVLWKKPYFLGYNLAITTGGTVNIILNFVLMGLNIFLVWKLFFN